MGKKLYILLVTMLMTTSTLIIVSNEFEVKATSGGGDEGEWVNETLLDYNFAWDVAWDFANVVHDDELWGEGSKVIRKGRSFGTNGDRWAANYTRDKMVDEFKMSDVFRDTIESISWKSDDWNDFWKYNYIVDARDFNLTINGHNPATIPLNETSAVPSVWPIHKCCLLTLDCNNTFQNIKVVPKNLTKWPSGETDRYNEDAIFNVSTEEILNYFTNFVGNVTYVSIDESLPIDQDGRFFLLDEEENCEDQLDNVTNATGVVLLHEYGEKGYSSSYNFSNLTAQCARVDKDDSNVTKVLEMLENDTFIMADNYLDEETIIFTHNFTCFNIPDHDYFVVSYFGLKNLAINTGFIWAFNCLSYLSQNVGYCYGTLLYDWSPDTHYMLAPVREWAGYSLNHEKSFKNIIPLI